MPRHTPLADDYLAVLDQRQDPGRALGVDDARVRQAHVVLLWDEVSVDEALETAAMLHALGDDDGAASVVRATLAQCTGLGGVPQVGEGCSNRDPVVLSFRDRRGR
ncbi:MAG: hypothetical protein H6733_10650 [Alphaproteobacteria bacterium]|nr:hypothetical protein [Alphaproteobacteria bacterium]